MRAAACLAALPGVAHMPSSASCCAEHSLIDQLRAAGATVSPSLHFFAPYDGAVAADSSNAGGGLQERGVIARCDIRRGEVLLSLPPGCYLPPPLQLAPELEPEPAAPSLLSSPSPRLVSALSELEPQPTAFLAATLQLLHIVSSNSTSGSSGWLASYISTLPSAYPHLPVCWRGAQLEALRGTTIDRSVVDRVERMRLGLAAPSKSSSARDTGRHRDTDRETQRGNELTCRSLHHRDGSEPPESSGCCYSSALREAFDCCVLPLVSAHPELFPPSGCTLAQFSACACAVSSRSFTTQLSVATGGATVAGYDALLEEEGRYMLPLVDMLNHCDAASAATTLRFEPPRGGETEGTFSMVAARSAYSLQQKCHFTEYRIVPLYHSQNW